MHLLVNGSSLNLILYTSHTTPPLSAACLVKTSFSWKISLNVQKRSQKNSHARFLHVCFDSHSWQSQSDNDHHWMMKLLLSFVFSPSIAASFHISPHTAAPLVLSICNALILRHHWTRVLLLSTKCSTPPPVARIRRRLFRCCVWIYFLLWIYLSFYKNISSLILFRDCLLCIAYFSSFTVKNLSVIVFIYHRFQNLFANHLTLSLTFTS